MKKTYLSNFNLVRPAYESSQEESINVLCKLRLELNPNLDPNTVHEKIEKYGKANSQIKKRGTEVPDFMTFLNKDIKPVLFEKSHLASLTERMNFYKEVTHKVFNQWYGPEYNEKKPDHLVHVTCTGYIAPNAAHTVSSKWAEKNHYTQVTNAYHMGCYASLPAIRIARGICLSKESSNVDIAHTEICSLHFDPTTLETMQIIVQSLFADGHIKYRLSDFQPKLGFQILALNEQTIPESLNMMTWVPNTQAFGMTLSKDIPLTIAPHLQKFVDELLSQAQIDNLSPIYFAIHPGGPKIIEGVEMMLDLSQEMTSESHEILAEYGNMSSSTLPHIWDRILKNEKRVDGAYVVSLGFGPGLTMSGAVFKICRT